jgi:ferredoxin
MADTALGTRLAQQLGDAARPVFVIDAEQPGVESRPGWRVYRGQVIEVQGRLGAFRITIQEREASEPRELQADQVVMLSQNSTAPCKTRTGCYVLTDPSASEVDRLAERMRDLMGDFLKTVHVSYQPDICAGGTANQQACGLCIPACPYEAISRDVQNPLRMAVDHLACEGCGACVSACPTSALRFTEPSPRELYTHLDALLAPVREHSHGERLVVLFHCSEQGRCVLDEAGKQSLHYPASVLPVEVPCLRYVSEANMLAAFRLGAAGVGLLGCDTCQHGERDLLYQQLDFCRLTLDAFAFGSDRVRLITATDGAAAEAITTLSRFAEGLDEAPLPWDGQPIRRTENRAVISETLARFMVRSGREPGRRTFQASYPFAFAEVQASGCTLCRACVNVCPVHAFKLEAATASLQYKHLACVACGLCQTVCPEHVITLRQEVYFEPAALAYQTVVQDDMIACARCQKPYINRKALEAVEARILSLDTLLETFSGQRRTLLRMCPECRAVAAMLEVEKGWEP